MFAYSVLSFQDPSIQAWHSLKEIPRHTMKAIENLSYFTVERSHLCHNPWCCAPAHVSLETRATNKSRENTCHEEKRQARPQRGDYIMFIEMN